MVIPQVLLKSSADLIAPSIAAIFNDALEHHEPLDIRKGMLILLQKPGKPVSPPTSVRPIVLLSAQRQRVTIEFLCIDLSRAFDTIRRYKLLEVLQSFLDEPELRMNRFLLAATSLEPRLSTGDCHAFASTIGTPQGDSLIPLLLIE